MNVLIWALVVLVVLSIVSGIIGLIVFFTAFRQVNKTMSSTFHEDFFKNGGFK